METQHNYKQQPTPLEELTDEEKIEKAKKLASLIAHKQTIVSQLETQISNLYQQKEAIIESFPKHQQKAIIDFFNLNND